MAAPMTDWPKCYARRRRRYVGSRLYTHRLLLFFAAALKILREWEQGVILRLGKFQAMRGPGITFVMPLIERMYRINTRVVMVDVPSQDVITKDNVTLNVNAVVFFRVLNPKAAVVEDDWQERRDMLEHVIILNAPHLRHLLTDSLTSYYRFLTPLSLDMDCPEPRAVAPLATGDVRALPIVGSLHHHDEPRAA